MKRLHSLSYSCGFNASVNFLSVETPSVYDPDNCCPVFMSVLFDSYCL